MGIKVKPRKGESIAQVVKRLRRMFEKEGLRRDIMRHRYHESPSERRRRQRRKSAKRARMRAEARR